MYNPTRAMLTFKPFSHGHPRRRPQFLQETRSDECWQTSICRYGSKVPYLSDFLQILTAPDIAEKARKAQGVRGTSAFAETQIEDENEGGSTQVPTSNQNEAVDEPGAPAEQRGLGKWGKKLAGGLSKFQR